MWNLTDLFKDYNEFNNSLEDILTHIKDIKKYEGCTSNKEELLNYLKEEEYIDRVIDRMSTYIYASYVTDYNNKEILELSSKLNNIKKEYYDNTSFFKVELQSLDSNEYNSLFDDNNFKIYKYKLNQIYKNNINKKNRVSYKSSRNKIINNIREFGTININNEEITITRSNYNRLLNNENKEIRKEVYNKYINRLKESSNDIAELLDKQIKEDNKYAKEEGFNDYYEYFLKEGEFSKKVFDNILNSIESNLDNYHKYFEINARLLNMSKLSMCDMNLDILKTEKNYTFDEAKHICFEALQPLGIDYAKHFQVIFDNKHIDYLPRDNKMIQYSTIPCIDGNSKVIINFYNDFISIRYLIHECGHHVHHQYINENNNIIYRKTSTYISEVASLTNELLLVDYIYKTSSKKNEKINSLRNILELYSDKLYGSTRNIKILLNLYNYVKDGNSLTVDYLNKMSYTIQEEYYGDSVELDDNMNLLWERQSLFFDNFYYLYYIISIIVATYIVNEINKGNTTIIDNYLKFLSCGSNMSLIDIIKTLGININDKEVILNTIEYYNMILNRYDELSK